MAWEVPLSFVVRDDDPHLPKTDKIRVSVTDLHDPQHVYFTADLPATTTDFVFPVGPDTTVPPGDYCLRLVGLSVDGAVSNDYSVLLQVDPPIPATPALAKIPATRLIVP